MTIIFANAIIFEGESPVLLERLSELLAIRKRSNSYVDGNRRTISSRSYVNRQRIQSFESIWTILISNDRAVSKVCRSNSLSLMQQLIIAAHSSAELREI